MLGSVLYIGAHPDDENTALLAYLAKGRRLRTGYLSLTRGDGGQNLIGTEQGETLGVIRTQELLAARRVDGAEQLFTRAVDFGYSKTAEETLRHLGARRGAGRRRLGHPQLPPRRDHHAASPRTGTAATAITPPRRSWRRRPSWPAADPTAVSRAARVRPALAGRSGCCGTPGAGTSRRRRPTPRRLVVDLGAYDPLLGQAYTELAATARIEPQEPGVRRAPRRGEPFPTSSSWWPVHRPPKDLLDGVDTTWRRVAGGDAVAGGPRQGARRLRRRSCAPPRRARRWSRRLSAMDALPADPWVVVKRRELVAADPAVYAVCGSRRPPRNPA